MPTLCSLEELKQPLRNPVLTIGNFDGVHRGHLALFDKVKERAKAIGGRSVVMTFDPHPTKVMKPQNGPPLITPTQQKLKLIQDAGIDVILCIPFTREFAAISAHDFIQGILVKRVGIREIVVGYDYAFGRERKGDIHFLLDMGSRFGFRVHVVEPVRIDHHLVSSTSVRQLVQEGRLAEAKKLLGRDYQICGSVVKGRNRGGRLLGCPTANLKPLDELTPKEGVYAVKVMVDDQVYEGVANIGDNPTFGNGTLSIETHLLDFSGDLLGKTIRIDFVARLRDEETYPNVEALAAQIRCDIEKARQLFSASGGNADG